MEQINFGTVLAVDHSIALFLDENNIDLYRLDIQHPVQSQQLTQLQGRKIQFNTDEYNRVIYAVLEGS